MLKNTIGVCVLILMMTLSASAQQPTDTTDTESEVDEEIVDEPEAILEDAVDAAERLINESASRVRSLGSVKRRESVKFDPHDTLNLSSSGYEGFAELDSIVPNYNVFLIGENHLYSKSNAQIWLKTIKYLNEYAGVRNVLFEYGASYGFLVNEYLQTRDTSLFNSITRFVYPAYSAAIKELAEYNSTLPDTMKLHFAGIDIDRGVYPILKSLDYLLPADISMLPDSVLLHVQSVKSLAEYNKTKLLDIEEGEKNYYGFTYKTAGTLDLLQSNFLNNESLFKELLGDNFAKFRKIIVDQYDERKEWLKYKKMESVQQYIYRETQMYRHFEEEYANNEGAWFGQFGRCHTIKKEVTNNSCEWYLFKSLADRMHSSTANDIKLMTIAQVYNNDNLFGTQHEEDANLFDDYLEKMEFNTVALFDLDSDTAILNAFGDEFDYIVFNKNTKLNSEVYPSWMDSDDTDDETITAFTVGFGAHGLDIENLSGLFADSLSSAPFQSNLDILTLGINASDGRFFSSFTFGVYAAQEREEFDKTYKLSGNFFRSTYGYDLAKGNVFSLVPALGFSGNSLNFTIREEQEIQLQDGGIGGLRIIEFRNPSFAFDFQFLAQVQLNGFTFGSDVSYVLDVSRKEWLTEGEVIDNSPKTSFNGMRWAAWVGWSF